MEIRVELEMGEAMRRLSTMPRRLSGALMEGAEDATTLALRELRTYPRERPARGRAPYRRTRTLERSWFRQVRRTSNGVVGEVLSNGQIAPYNIWVQHARYQAAVHVGVWQTDAQVAERIQPQVVEMFTRRIQIAANG